jgi:Fic family protein
MANVLESITKLKEELNGLRPLPQATLDQVEQKLRLESNFHSNAIEGNTLTLGETRSLILHGLTAHGKPLRDHLDIQGHDSAVKAIEGAVKDNQELNEVFIRNLHRVLLKEPYTTRAETPGGQVVERPISLGEYKAVPNNVRTSTGETFYFTPPEQVKQAMSDLIDWYREVEQQGEHPIIIAATFHYRFVRIHPFDDGNGRMARLLMNLILIKHGYTVAIIPQEGREQYLGELERADQSENLGEFINYSASCCEYSLSLHLRAARGEPIDDIEDIDKEIALFKQSLVKTNEQAFSAKEYVQDVINSLCQYCYDRASRLSDVFVDVYGDVKLIGTTPEGSPVEGSRIRQRDDRQVTLYLIDVETIPAQLHSVNARIRIDCYHFQGRREVSPGFSIENRIDISRCEWKFACDDPDIELDYVGRDLDDLKRLFNQLLRETMKHLGQRSS